MRLPIPALFAIAAALPATSLMAGSCESLASVKLENATFTSAAMVAAGKFEAPSAAPAGGPPAAAKGGAPDAAKGGAKGGGKGKGPNPYANLPEFCRVMATLAPSKDSDIKVEIWFPSAAGWNGKYQAVGNGGWAGVISYSAMALALERGYATSSTDTGHVGGRGTFAMDHPEKLTDYSYRAVHEMVVKSKELIRALYASPARYSYWVGCSTGGRQGVTEAQKYPNDFDGIIAGAPANYFTHLHAWSIWINQAVNKTPESFLETKDLQTLHAAVLKACDAMDGVTDNVIDNPKKCKFDPATIQCASGATTGCLTAPQVAAVKMIYSPAINPRTKAEVFPPIEPGSELVWGTLAGRKAADVAADTFRYLVFKDENWNPLTLNFDGDMTKADKVAETFSLNSTNPDLSKYFSHGGKLIMYHGWSDQLIAPGNSINYYNSVVQKAGSKAADEIKLYMVPGMQHCNGGDGPNVFDAVSQLENWVEHSKTPDVMVASHSAPGPNGAVDRTRPLCTYPKVAKYSGSGSTNEAANFSCVAP